MTPCWHQINSSNLNPPFSYPEFSPALRVSLREAFFRCFKINRSRFWWAGCSEEKACHAWKDRKCRNDPQHNASWPSEEWERTLPERAMTTWLLQNPRNYRKLTLQRLDFLEGGRKWEKDKELGGLLKKNLYLKKH